MVAAEAGVCASGRVKTRASVSLHAFFLLYYPALHPRYGICYTLVVDPWPRRTLSGLADARVVLRSLHRTLGSGSGSELFFLFSRLFVSLFLRRWAGWGSSFRDSTPPYPVASPLDPPACFVDAVDVYARVGAEALGKGEERFRGWGRTGRRSALRASLLPMSPPTERLQSGRDRGWVRVLVLIPPAPPPSQTQPRSTSEKTPFTAIFRRRSRRRPRFTMLTPGPGSGAGSGEFVDDENMFGDDVEGDWAVVRGSPTSPTSSAPRAVTGGRGSRRGSRGSRRGGGAASPPSPTSPTSPMEPGTGATEADPFLTRLPNPHDRGVHTMYSRSDPNLAHPRSLHSTSPTSSPEIPYAAAGVAAAAAAAVAAGAHHAHSSPDNRGGAAGGNGGNSGSASSKGTSGSSETTSSGTNISGYGELLPHPSFPLPPVSPGLGDLPPGAAPPGSHPPSYNPVYSLNDPTNPATLSRRILSPAQMAVLVEEVEPHSRASRAGGGGWSSAEKGKGKARARDSGEYDDAGASGSGSGKRRSWIPRFSWFNRNSTGSAGEQDQDQEGEAGMLLFDAGRSPTHSPSNSMSASPSPRPTSPSSRERPTSPVGPRPRAPSLTQRKAPPVWTGAGTGSVSTGSNTNTGVGSVSSAGAVAGSGAASGGSTTGGESMREFGARPLLGLFTRSRPGSGNNSPRPASGISSLSGGGRSGGGMSSDGTNGTNGSARSGGTVYTDARETLSTRGSRGGLGTPMDEAPLPPLPTAQGRGEGQAQDPLDAPAPAALAAFSSTASLHHAPSQASFDQHQHQLHEEHSRDGSTGAQTTAGSATLGGSASNTTLATHATADAPSKPERAYAYGAYGPPPGLDSFNADVNALNASVVNDPAALPPMPPMPLGTKGSKGSVGSWDQAGLELGFSRAPSHSLLGTFGSKNAVPLPPPGTGAGPAPGIRIVGAPSPSPAPSSFPQHPSPSPFLQHPSPLRPAAPLAPPLPTFGDERRSSAPHLSLDLEDAPPGAEGRWRLLGGSAQSLLLGSSTSSLGANGSGEWGEGAGRRGTFGLGPTAQYVHSAGHSSEHGSFHSRVGNASLASSLSSATGSSNAHARLPTGHTLYPSSGSGSGSGHSAPASARARVLAHAGSVEGPMSPTLREFVWVVGSAEEPAGEGDKSGEPVDRTLGGGFGSGLAADVGGEGRAILCYALPGNAAVVAVRAPAVLGRTVYIPHPGRAAKSHPSEPQNLAAAVLYHTPADTPLH
ncbi:hypothetical protein MSAN_00442500 [Mycena sanguinolenta]|uniref:Uncharacterized protein n=1 Tax=Mycena sanguinolenta TaxID=230812 RepID=A0A8H6ZAK2_9AGAR|nr:hypothetical protein MSAN_00442500 [Mycena sanguinolenta]